MLKSTLRFLLTLSLSLINVSAGAQDYAPLGGEDLEGPSPLAGERRPFGSHLVSYVDGTILPQKSQAELDNQTKQFYNKWKAKFVAQGCGTGRYYVLPGGVGGGMDPNSISVSEGHGFGMVITAYMAGYDANAKKIFDGMYWFFRDHPSVYSPHLMAWNQVKGCGNVDGDDTSSATDGDLDIAYALLLADRQWGSSVPGGINYLAEAKKVINAILTKEIHPTSNTVLLGDWAADSGASYLNGTRTSDFMTDHFKSFARVGNVTRWNAVLNKSYSISKSLQSGYSASTGLLPDFVEDATSSPRPARSGYLEGSTDGAYSYNACRAPWRLAMDFFVNGNVEAKNIVQKMNKFIRSKTNGNPSQIRDGYRLNGTVIGSYPSMAFVAPFAVGAMVDSSNQAWLNSLWDTIVSTSITSGGYYENSIKMLNMIVLSSNYWKP
ncbi:MAG: glycosyl hydrolase family 8 [Bdellovibrionia bacterium]